MINKPTETMKKVQKNFRMPEELLEAIDGIRGSVELTTWIIDAMEEKLLRERQKKEMYIRQ